MESLGELGRRVRFWLHRSEANRELEEEMQFHLQMKARQYQEAGMPEREAPFAAQRQFGNPLLLKELSSDAWGWRWLETFLQDVRFAARAMKQNKVFTAVAVLTLALGIGANAIMFSLVDGVWTRPIPVRDPRGLVHIFATDQKGQPDTISYPDYLDFKAQARSLADLFVEDRRGPTLKGDGWTQPTLTVATSQNYFTTLGVGAQAGRMYTDNPEPPGEGPILVLSYNLWQRRFHGDAAIVGRAVRLMDTAFTVVGVAAKGFRGTELGEEVDLWIPMASWDVFSPNDSKDRRFHDFVATGRLRPGATPEQARAELQLIAARLAANYPNSNAGRGAILKTDFEYRVAMQHYQPFLLLGIVVLVLLIACANVANLLLARGEARTREIGMRLALGCSRLRLIRQLLTESLVLGAAGAACGLALAAGGIRLLPAFFQSGGLLVANSGGQPIANEFLLDARVLVFTLLVSLATVLFFGLLPAMRLSKLSPSRAARDGAPRARGGLLRGPGLLVSAQVALSFILLMSAGLFARTLIQAMHADLGFERKNVLLLEMVPPGNHDHAMAFYDGLIDRLRSLPGVRRACVTLHPPMAGYGGGFSDQVEIPGYLLPPGTPKLEIHQNRVGSGFFELLGARLLRGRVFDAHDTAKSHGVAVINHTMEQRYFAGQDPVGRVIRIGLGDNARDTEIVGVVRDIRVNTIEEQPEPYIFLAYSQAANWAEATLMVETAGDPMRYANAIRRAGLALNPEVDISPPTTLENTVQDRLQGSRTTATAVGILAMLGLILASIGLYGVMSYSVARRKREIGIRMALGARFGGTVGLVLRRGMTLAGVGAAAGVLGALAATRLLANMLYNVGPYDPMTLAAVAAVLSVVSLAACYIPARRAVRVDPAVAVREE